MIYGTSKDSGLVHLENFLDWSHEGEIKEEREAEEKQ